MGCAASKPGLVNEFRDVKIEQIQNAKLTPPTVGQVVAQPKQPAAEDAPKKPNLQPQPGFFDANLTFANVVWNSPSTAPQAASKPALKAPGAPAAAQPKKAEAKAPAPAPAPQPKPAAAPVAWPVRPEDAWGQDPDGWDDYDEDEDEEDDAGRVVDPDMFRTRVNHANFEWEGTPEHTDVAPKKDDKQMVNPFAGVPIALPAAGGAAKAPAAAAPASKASPLEQAANAVKAAEGKDSKPAAAATLASPFAAGMAAKAPAAAAPKAAAAAPIASPFAGGASAKPLAGGGAADAQATAAAAMQSILMSGTPDQQALMRTLLQNQAQAQARSRAQATFATAPVAGGVYPAVQHTAQAQAVPNGYTNEMLMQQIAQARAMQQQQQAQMLQQQRQAAASGWMG